MKTTKERGNIMSKNILLLFISMLMVLTVLFLGIEKSGAQTQEPVDSQEVLEIQEDQGIEENAEIPEVMEAQEAEESQEAIETVEIIGTQETTELSQNENPAPKSQDVTIVVASSQNNSRISLYERYFNRVENKHRAIEIRRRNIEAGR
ncbi:MAG: hypothetical protein A2X59_08470 [Nitrospirae bacterium GWC2_42_7]|nr:MAG: hypothetical protein A2X59_08470 [Nitrospirae bacterium GWC2_42_7]